MFPPLGGLNKFETFRNDFPKLRMGTIRKNNT